MSAVEILKIFDYITKNKVDYCKICLRTEHERKLVHSKTLKKLILYVNMKFEDELSICYVCEAKVMSAMNVLMALNFAGAVSSLYKQMRKNKNLKDQLHDHLTASTFNREGGSAALHYVHEATLCQTLLSSIQKRTLLTRTNTLHVNCVEVQSINISVPPESNISDTVRNSQQDNDASVGSLHPVLSGLDGQLYVPTLNCKIVNGVLQLVPPTLSQPQTNSSNNSETSNKENNEMNNSVRNIALNTINNEVNVNSHATNNAVIHEIKLSNNISNESNGKTSVAVETEKVKPVKRNNKGRNNSQITEACSFKDELLKQKGGELKNNHKRLRSETEASSTGEVTIGKMNNNDKQLEIKTKDIILIDDDTDDDIEITEVGDVTDHDDIAPPVEKSIGKDCQTEVTTISIKDVFSMIEDQNKTCDDDLQVIDADDADDAVKCDKISTASKGLLRGSDNIDWEDKIPMDVISFMENENEAPADNKTSNSPKISEVRSVLPDDRADRLLFFVS